MLLFRRHVATTGSIRPTNGLPGSLSVLPLTRRQITTCRWARSAASLVGETHSTRANVHLIRGPFYEQFLSDRS
jgi:hypothetical protein